MSIYSFIVNFIGEVPPQFEFVYIIFTIALGLLIFSLLCSIFFLPIKIIKG